VSYYDIAVILSNRPLSKLDNAGFARQFEAEQKRGIIGLGDGESYSQTQEETMRRDIKEQIREQIRSDTVNKNLNVAHQNRHFRDSGGYIEGGSYFFEDIDPDALIRQYYGTGDPRLTKNRQWTNKEFVDLDRDIGVDINTVTGIETITNRFSIHYSKHGAHIVPARRLWQ
jgi:hypothetical protein